MTLDSAEKDLIQKELERFESPRSATLPILHLVQKKRGWISEELILELSSFTGLPATWLQEVRDFYTMYNKKPVGQNHVQVCTNISCAMKGGRELAQKICDHYQVKPGEVSPCGKVTVSQVECLGACDKAPMMQVGEDYYEDLSQDQALEILKGLES